MQYYVIDNDIINTCNIFPENIFSGDIFYEVIRIIDSKPLFFHDHLERFFNSITLSGHNSCSTKKEISLRIKLLIKLNNLIEGNIRFQSSFSGNETFSAWVSPFFYPDKELYNSGVVLKTINIQRNKPNLKQHNSDYKKAVENFITNNNCYEALLVNNENLITEGSKSNVFFIKEKSVITPPVDNILPGITRQKVVALCIKNNVPIFERHFNINELATISGAFITGTSPKILPVKAIDNITYNPENPISTNLLNNYNIMINNDILNFSWSNFI